MFKVESTSHRACTDFLRARLRWLPALLVLAAGAAQNAHASNPIFASGYEHSCTVASSGALYCWGRNAEGQLGTGVAGPDHDHPQKVVGLPGPVRAVSAGDTHTCAITTAGALYCWGNDSWGQLGDGTANTSGYRAVPAQVVGLGSGVASVAAGGAHTCASLLDGTVRCFGRPASGELGNGESGVWTARPTPITVAISGVSAVAARTANTCALKANGEVWCWGDNAYSQTGSWGGPNSTDPTPTRLYAFGAGQALGQATAITVGNAFACAQIPQKAVCWGQGTNLGNDDPWPTDQGFYDVVEVAAGYSHACVRRSPGSPSVECWFGQPITVNDPNLRMLAPGGKHTCAAGAGGIWCWGDDTRGQLLDGSMGPNSPWPKRVLGLSGPAVQLALGEQLSCARLANGSVPCWGGGSDPHGVPSTTLALQSGVTLVSLGSQMCVVQDGVLKCGNRYGLTAVSGLPAQAVLEISTGQGHQCARVADGSVWCWGSNAYGEIGTGTVGGSFTSAQQVTALGTGVSQIAAGDNFTCALQNGGVKCWGRNNFSQLIGATSNANSPVPLAIPSLTSGVTSISLGYDHACAAMASGGVRCWGWINGGVSPSLISNLTGAIAATSGNWELSCALAADGRAHCWGYDDFGETGDGSIGFGNRSRTSAAPVVGLAPNIGEVATGYRHACALDQSGAVYCWGRDQFGELGDGVDDPYFVAAPQLALPILDGSAPPLPGDGISAPTTSPYGYNGQAVAMSDQVMVVSEPGTGIVRVYDRNPSTGGFGTAAADSGKAGLASSSGEWPTVASAELRPLGKGVPADRFGHSVAISPNGATIVVGEPGAEGSAAGRFHVYRRPGATWGALALPAPSATLNPAALGGVTPINFGESVDIDADNNIVVGAPESTVSGHSRAGAIYAYRDGGGASVTANGNPLTVPAPQQDANYGEDVAVDEGLVVGGAPGQDDDAGGVHVTPPVTPGGGGGFGPPQSSGCIIEAGVLVSCGKSVAIMGDTVVVGAPGATNPATNDPDAGMVEIFRILGLGKATMSITQVSTLRPIAGSGQRLGTDVGINATAVVAGAPDAPITLPGQGRGYVFLRPDGGFKAGETLPDAIIGSPANAQDDHFGAAVAVSERNLVVGIPLADTNTTIDAGRADTYVFDRINIGGFE